MSLTYFPVAGTFLAIVSDSNDPGGTPDTQNISSFVYFTPSVKQVFSSEDETIYRLQTIRARTQAHDGELKNIDGTGVELVANSSALDLDELRYTVTFDHVVYDKAERIIKSFVFVAPTDATAVNLATVARVKP